MGLNFVKLAGKWYVQLPNYPYEIEDLEMILNAAEMCEILDDDKDGLIHTLVSTKDDCDVTSSHKLEFIKSEELNGAWYHCVKLNMDIWLCDVTKYVFGNFPSEIYISILD